MASTAWNGTARGQSVSAGNAPLAAHTGPVAASGSLWVAVLLSYSFLIPTNVQFAIGGFVFLPYRLVLLAAIPWIIGHILRRTVRFVLPDYLMLLMVAWIFLALNVTADTERMISNGFANLIDILLPYLVARLAFRSLYDIRHFLVVMAPGFAIIALFMVAEAFGGNYLMQPFALSFFGGPDSVMMGQEVRWGMLRAMGPFAHPILAGLHLAALFPLYYKGGLRGWPFLLGLFAGIASVFTVSAAVMISIMLTAGLLIYDALTYRFSQLTWRLFMIGAAVFILVAELGTKSGAVNLIIRFASFNSGSGFSRVLIWRYGSDAVEQNPLFGIGFNEWSRPFWMSSSVDNYWLNLAMLYGLVPALSLLLVTIIIVALLARRTALWNARDQATIRGLAISITVFALGAYSVSLWVTTQSWFMLLLGMGMAATTWRPAQPRYTLANR